MAYPGEKKRRMQIDEKLEESSDAPVVEFERRKEHAGAYEGQDQPEKKTAPSGPYKDTLKYESDKPVTPRKKKLGIF